MKKSFRSFKDCFEVSVNKVAWLQEIEKFCICEDISEVKHYDL